MKKIRRTKILLIPFVNQQRALEIKLLKLEKQISKAERLKLKKMDISSSIERKARTRSLIQLGGLIEKADLLDVFNIPLGIDLQKDPSIKKNVGALFKGLLELRKIATSKEASLELWSQQGIEALSSSNMES